MHSLNHQAYAHAVAAERVEAARGRAKRSRRSHRPPPVRSRVAYLAARAARRLDPAAARRAIP
jgi:hypothetical protein